MFRLLVSLIAFFTLPTLLFAFWINCFCLEFGFFVSISAGARSMLLTARNLFAQFRTPFRYLSECLNLKTGPTIFSKRLCVDYVKEVYYPLPKMILGRLSFHLCKHEDSHHCFPVWKWIVLNKHKLTDWRVTLKHVVFRVHSLLNKPVLKISFVVLRLNVYHSTSNIICFIKYDLENPD